MKFYLSICLSFLCLCTGFTQNDFSCGTLPPPYNTNVQFMNRVSGPTANWAILPACKSAIIRVAFHLIKRSNGTGGFDNTNNNIHSHILTVLNNKFNNHNIFFQLAQYNDNGVQKDVDVINDDAAYNISIGQLKSDKILVDGKFDNYNMNSRNDVIDIYLLANNTSSNVRFPVAGVAANIGATSFIINQNENALITDVSDRTIAHEMGHCLGLYHTFFGTACNDNSEYLINRTNYSFCEQDGLGNGLVAGDYVADTYADPTAGVEAYADNDCRADIAQIPIYHSVNCNSTSSAFDDGNAPWHPYVDNIMDYGTRYPCITRFTPGQAARMLSAIANDLQVNQTVIKVMEQVTITPNGSTNRCSTDPTPLILTASTANPNYQFDWHQSILTVMPTITTTYTVTATSQCMLTTIESITVHVDNDIDFTIDGLDNVCKSATGILYSTNPATYNGTGTWGSSVAASINSITGELATGLTPGKITIDYSVPTTLSNGQACVHKVDKEVNIVDASQQVTITASKNSVCDGAELIGLSVPAIPGLSFTWNTNPIQSGNSITVTPTNNYFHFEATAISPCGGNVSDYINITIHALPSLSITPFSGSICAGNNYPIIFSTNLSPSLVNWSVSPSTASIYPNNSPSPEFLPLANDNYTITANTFPDNNGCTNTAFTNVSVFPNQVAITNDPNTLKVCTSKLFQFTANATGGLWTVSNQALATIDANGMLTAIAPGTVQVSYSVNLCNSYSIDTKDLTIEATPQIIVSNNLLCMSGSYTFAANVPGSWMSENTTIASVGTPTVNTADIVPNAIGSTLIKFTPTYLPSCMQEANISIPITVSNCTPVSCSDVIATSNSISPDPNGFIGVAIYTGGIYYIDKNITITNELTLVNVQVNIASGKSITVADGATLNIVGSHLYSCDGMWEGIKAFGDEARVKITGNGVESSFIEDALTAVYYKPNTLIPNYGIGNLVEVSNTIFNKNRVSIRIEGFEDDYNNGAFPFSIANCIFTSRKIGFDPTIASWNNVAAIKNNLSLQSTPFTATPLSYASPYIDEALYNDAAPEAYLNDGNYVNKPMYGVILKNVGLKNTLGDFRGITIGGDPSIAIGGMSNTNIFDNQDIGIKVEQSNVVVNNCTFQKPNPTGSIAVRNGIGIKVENTINNSIEVNTPSGYPRNAFFDLNTAIDIDQSDRIVISNCDIRSNQVPSPDDMGLFGIKISDHYYHQIAVSHNNIHNIRNGIWYMGGIDRTPGGNGANFGNLNVSNNLIADQLATLPNTAAHVTRAIELSAIIYSSEPTHTVCSNNEIVAAATGIKLSGWKGSKVNNNMVLLAPDISATPVNEQYGIYIEGYYGDLLGSTVENNNITGYDITANTTGILLSQATRVILGCNTVGGNQHGFRFVGNNPQTKFWDNTMLTSNKYGFTLDNQGVIDQQGDDGTIGGKICASNNSWASGSSGWPSGHFMTYTNNSLPAQSPFVILNNPLFPEVNPQLGNSSIANSTYIYSNTNGLIEKPTSSPNCDRCTGANQNYQRPKTLLEEIAEGTILLPNDDPEERLMVMQQQLYDLLNANPNQLTNSNSLQQFMFDNHWSNLDFIQYAARYVATGQYDKVALLLGVWPGQSPLDSSYYQYFDWLVQMHNDSSWLPDNSEMLALANKCPIKYGLVVYAVRNLFNALNGEIVEFENSCEPEYEAKGGTKNVNSYDFIRLKKKVMPIVKLPTGVLKINPNPASTSVNIYCSKMNTIEIIDVSGRQVWHGNASGKDVIQIDVSRWSNGMFIIKTINVKGQQFFGKLMVSRR